MSPAPVASIVIPCYNAEAFLAQTIESVLAQTVQDFEVVVVNDGSKDNSLAVAHQCAAQDSRVRVIDKPNSGVSDTRNQGAAACQAEFITFLDADDLWLPQNLELKIAALRAQPQAVAATSAYEIFQTDTGETVERVPCDTKNLAQKLLEFRGPTGMLPASVVMRRSAFDAAGGWDTALSTAADQDLWLRLALRGPVCCVPQSLVRYRLHPGQMHRNIGLMKHDVDILYQKARKAGAFRSWRHYRWCMARKSMVLAGSFYRNAHNRSSALREAARAFWFHPGVLWQRLVG